MEESTEYVDFSQLQEFIGITDIESLKLYLREIYKDLISRTKDVSNKFLTKITFIEYINLPIIIAEKLFHSFDEDKDGFLNLREFSKNLVDLYTGTFEEVVGVVFNILDFDHDGNIIPEDVKLLLQYLPLNTKNEYKFQMASLNEINSIISELFKDKKQLNLTEFIIATENHHSDAFLQILCFLYERKPFTNRSIVIISSKKLKLLNATSVTGNKTINNQINGVTIKTPTSPKKNIPSPNKYSLLSPVRLLDDMVRNKTPTKQPLDLDSCVPFSLDETPVSKISTDNLTMITSTINKGASSSYQNYLFKVNPQNKVKQYYVVLTGKDMYYFNSNKMTEILGMHHISGCNVKQVVECKIEGETFYCFGLDCKNRKRKYYAKTYTTAFNWYKHLVNAIGNLNFYNYYEIIGNIGEGKFGIVKLCRNKTTDLKVAVKIITRSEMEESDIELLYNELEIMKLVHHPNIVNLVDLFETSEHIFIVMDYYKGGDLTQYLMKHKSILSESVSANLIQQIGNGIKYLHEYGIVHRDLKPDNIMLSDNSGKPGVRIMDFGLSKIMGVNDKVADGYGTLSFVAPEVLLRKPYNREIDIWSIGIITYYCLSGTLPFDDENDDEESIAKQVVFSEVKFPTRYWRNRSGESIDFITNCLIKDPNKRMNINVLLEHPWFKKFIKDNDAEK